MRSRVAAAAAIALVAGCGGGADGAGGRILRVAYEREIDVLNPFTSQNLADIGFTMIEGLVTTNERNEYLPVLATRIPTRENGLVTTRPDGRIAMTWPLRSGVRWHDSVPFTASDVCFTWRFVVDPKSETYNREQYLGIVGCDAPNDTTAVLTWDREYGYYAGLFEAILPEHVLRGMSADQIVNFEGYNRGPKTIGTGPFRFGEWKAGEYIRVVRNPDYWRGDSLPRIDQIVFAFIPDANTRLNAIKAGGYHFARIQPNQVKDIRAQPGYRTNLISSNSVMHLDLSVRTPNGQALFGDAEVRRAIFQAIDREGIASRLMEGTVTVANSPLSLHNPYHADSLDVPRYDPAAARAILEAAGWRPGPDGIRVRNGRRMAFTMLNRAGATDRIAVAQVIQAQLKAIGVEVAFETLESAAWTERWRRGDWEAVVSAWFLPADPSLTNLYACRGANNMTGLCDPDLDRVLERSDHTLDVEARKRDLALIQRRLLETARTIPLYYNVVPEVVADNVGGYRGSGTNFGSFWNVFDWTVSP